MWNIPVFCKRSHWNNDDLCIYLSWMQQNILIFVLRELSLKRLFCGNRRGLESPVLMSDSAVQSYSGIWNKRGKLEPLELSKRLPVLWHQKSNPSCHSSQTAIKCSNIQIFSIVHRLSVFQVLADLCCHPDYPQKIMWNDFVTTIQSKNFPYYFHM